jgi:N-acetylmuramoyl-L-alanine amidase
MNSVGKGRATLSPARRVKGRARRSARAAERIGTPANEQPWRVHKTSIFLFSILPFIVFLAACAGPEHKLTPLYHEPTQAPIQAEQPIAQPQPTQTPPQTQPVQPIEPKPEPKPIVEPTEVKPPITKPPTTAAWASLQDWCAENKLHPPLVVHDKGQTNITVRSDNGVFAFEFPRRNARWNGILLGVGFAPVFTNHHIVVNTIDLTKVLQPLLLTNDIPKKHGGILVIDPGHGGANEGAVSHDHKFKEKQLTLDWAFRVQKLLEGSDWHVILTRTNDIDLSLTNRVAIADTNKADLFISLHFNSIAGPKESGLESYSTTPVGMASHVTRTFADDINLTFPNNEFDIENFLLAFDMHRAMLRKTGREDRGVRRARFMTVLREQRRPAVLLEGGYLSNPEEAKLICTAGYRQRLAEAVAEALGVSTAPLTTLRQ